jgi:hypothetical protein
MPSDMFREGTINGQHMSDITPTAIMRCAIQTQSESRLTYYLPNIGGTIVQYTLQESLLRATTTPQAELS